MIQIKKSVAAVMAATVLMAPATQVPAKSTAAPATAAPQSSPAAVDYMSLQPYKMSIMAGGDAAKITDEFLNHPYRKQVYKAFEDFTNTQIEWIFYDLNLYNEKATLAIAAGDLPSVMVQHRNADLFSAGEKGYFWELQEVYKNFENLATYNPITISNASQNGKLYGLPRVRDVARNGIYINQNWMDNLGLNPPETVDELYDMLVAFTFKDPNASGKNDTVGMLLNPTGSITHQLMWFGGGNGWVEEKGELIPVELTPEYDITVEFLRKGFADGVIKPFPEGVGNSAAFEQELIGFVAAYMDDSARTQDNMIKAGKDVEIYITNGLSPKKGEDMRFAAIDGFNQLLAISTQKVKTAEELNRVLYFFDRMCEPEMMAILNWGFEGITYTVDASGYATTLTAAEKEAKGIDTIDFRNGFNQMVPLMENPDKQYLSGGYTTELRERIAKTRDANVQYAIGNPAAGYTSAARQEIGADLDKIINEARGAYILGEIDDSTWQKEKQRWLDAGQKKVIEEINEIHKMLKK